MSSAERMEFPLWKLLCAPALVRSAIKPSALKMIFNDVLNSKVSKFSRFAFGTKLLRTRGFLFYFVKNPARETQKLWIP